MPFKDIGGVYIEVERYIMCKIYDTRKNIETGTVFLHIEDDEAIGIKKLSLAKFDFAKKFKNMDFLDKVSSWTNERDLMNSYYAKDFRDPDIVYSEY